MLLVQRRERVLLAHVPLLARALAQLRQRAVDVACLLLHRAARLLGILVRLHLGLLRLALERQRRIGPHVGPGRVHVTHRCVALARPLVAVFQAQEPPGLVRRGHVPIGPVVVLLPVLALVTNAVVALVTQQPAVRLLHLPARQPSIFVRPLVQQRRPRAQRRVRALVQPHNVLRVILVKAFIVHVVVPTARLPLGVVTKRPRLAPTCAPGHIVAVAPSKAVDSLRRRRALAHAPALARPLARRVHCQLCSAPRHGALGLRATTGAAAAGR